MSDFCRNCKEPINGNYCSNCGQPAQLKRIDKHYIIQEVGDFLFANRGMVYTIRNVLVRPGESVRRFITEDRYRFVKPVTFLFISALFFALLNNLFNIYDYSFDELGGAAFLMNWLIEHPAYTNITAGLFVSFWIKIFFKKAGYNFFEILILLCFVFGISTLIDSVAIIIQGIMNLKFEYISIFIGTIYITWAVGQFFDKKKAASYAKAFLSYFLGMLTFGLLIVIFAIVEIVNKL